MERKSCNIAAGKLSADPVFVEVLTRLRKILFSVLLHREIICNEGNRVIWIGSRLVEKSSKQKDPNRFRARNSIVIPGYGIDLEHA
jgi:hypothetical protein